MVKNIKYIKKRILLKQSDNIGVESDIHHSCSNQTIYSVILKLKKFYTILTYFHLCFSKIILKIFLITVKKNTKNNSTQW